MVSPVVRYAGLSSRWQARSRNVGTSLRCLPAMLVSTNSTLVVSPQSGGRTLSPHSTERGIRKAQTTFTTVHGQKRVGSVHKRRADLYGDSCWKGQAGVTINRQIFRTTCAQLRRAKSKGVLNDETTTALPTDW